MAKKPSCHQQGFSLQSGLVSQAALLINIRHSCHSAPVLIFIGKETFYELSQRIFLKKILKWLRFFLCRCFFSDNELAD
jgi:hypothetical protein